MESTIPLHPRLSQSHTTKPFDSIFLVAPQGAWPTELEKFLAKHQRTFPEHLASHLKKSG